MKITIEGIGGILIMVAFLISAIGYTYDFIKWVIK